MHILAPLSTSPTGHSRPAVHGQTQHLNGMPCGVGPPTSETVLPNLSEGLEHVDDAPSSAGLSALSVAPLDFHSQHFTKSSEKSDGRAKDVWMWYWPVESKESSTPLKHDEPILTQRPKSSAIACRLCWRTDNWKAYKLCDGIVTTLRNHLRREHETIYQGYLRSNAWEIELCKRKGDPIGEPFDLAGFLDRLIRWIVSDDQASNALVSFLDTLSDAVAVYQCCR
jgi:hypothetical protein